MMHLSQTSTKGFNDLVFDHRNQAYGAYVLRREYPVNVLKSLLIGVAIIASILAMPYLAKLLRTNAVMRRTTKPPTEWIIDAHPPTVKPPDIQKKIKPPKGNPNLGGIPFIVNVPLDSIPEEIQDSSSNVGTLDGDSTLNERKGKESVANLIGEKKDTTTHSPFGLDRNPGFPGGEEALHRFLGDNLVYPEYAKTMGIEGRVYVTFVVNEKGKVIHIKVPREIGGGCDAEAMRVVELMPIWEPGILDGVPVRVSYQLPIVFKLNW